MRARTNIALKDRKMLCLSDFKGVDFSSSPLRVRKDRATSMRNLINEYGVNRKRHGWRELLRIEEGRINGIFDYVNGEHRETLVHAGTGFFRIKKNENGMYGAEKVNKDVKLTDERSEAFLYKGRMYITGCGDYLVYGTWDDDEKDEKDKTYELRRVAGDEHTYVPTTTVSNDADGTLDTHRASLDEVNYLTPWRKNQLLGTPMSNATWTLDGPIDDGTEVDIVLETAEEFEDEDEKTLKVPVTYTIDNVRKNEVGALIGGLELYITEENGYRVDKAIVGKISDWSRLNEFITVKLYIPTPPYYEAKHNIAVTYTSFDSSSEVVKSKTVLGSNEDSLTFNLDSKNLLADTEVRITVETFIIMKPVTYKIKNEGNYLKIKERNGETIESDEPCGSIDFEKGKITFTRSTVPQIAGRDNITVKFSSTVKEASSDKIEKCRFGVMFGVDGNADRLFLSGNPDHPNVDFYSQDGDLTYFPAVNTASMGSDATAICGYARLSDSTLVIYKEDDGREATVFYRTGSYETEKDADTGLSYVREIFRHTAGSIGEGLVSRHAIANLAGDSLMLSRNGVFGMVLGSNVATTERYARERSRTINERLCRSKDLSEAVGIVYKNRYYLAVGGARGECYVADARYKYTASDDVDGSYNYEWWFWDNIPARVWALPSNEDLFGSDVLVFGSADGRICVFDEAYTDRTYVRTAGSDLGFSYDEEDNCSVTVSKEIMPYLKVGRKIVLRCSIPIYARVADAVTVNNDRIVIGDDNIYRYHNGMEVYVDNVSGDLTFGTEYYISDVDWGNGTYVLVDKNNKQVDLGKGGFHLRKKVSDKTLYIGSVVKCEEGGGTITLCEHREAIYEYEPGDEATRPKQEYLVFAAYNGNIPGGDGMEEIAEIEVAENVVAEWYTPVFDLGTNESSKTLLKMTIATEPEVNGKLSFGYETRNTNRLIGGKGISVFSFDNFSFENFSFDTGFSNSYSVRMNERNFNFIMFRFVSDNDADCAVNTFTVLYKINKSNIGVR